MKPLLSISLILALLIQTGCATNSAIRRERIHSFDLEPPLILRTTTGDTYEILSYEMTHDHLIAVVNENGETVEQRFALANIESLNGHEVASLREKFTPLAHVLGIAGCIGMAVLAAFAISQAAFVDALGGT